MSPIAKLILIFCALCFVVLVVYILVVRAYYWGDKKVPPQKKINPKVDETK